MLFRSAEYPFHHLDPAFGFDERYRWWTQKLRSQIEEFGRQHVARSILSLEYVAYASRKPGIDERLRLPSQEYAFHLVRLAVRRRAVVVLLRAKRLWLAALPDLQAYEHLHELHGPQNTALTRLNCPHGFEAIRRALRGEQPPRARAA